MHLGAMFDCCWKQLKTHFHQESFTTRKFNDLVLRMYPVTPGAVILCKATGGNYVPGFGRSAKQITSEYEKFFDAIEENELGEIVIMPKFKNPAHQSTIEGYLWICNKDNIGKYVEKVKNQRKASPWRVG